MFKKFASLIVEKLVSYEVINCNEKRIYSYGFELLTSSVVGVIVLVIVSVFSGVPSGWIPYLLGFIPYRLTGGGCHAKSHAGCIFLFTSAYIIATLCFNHFTLHRYFGIFCNLCLVIVFFFFAPVEAENKPLSPATRRTNRLLSIAIGFFNVIFSIVMANIPFISELCNMYFMGNTTAGISILIAAIIHLAKRSKM